MDKLVECIYCQELKKESKFSLEHVIPQFLGGSQCPDKLKTREVCNRCNNNLGLFVDAAYQKEFATNGFLNNAYYAFFDPNKPIGLPLNCIGISKDLSPPRINKNEVCEMWIGPLGEQVFWVRPDDERMFWYSGGNPRTVKSQATRAYFMLSERSEKAPHISLLLFKGKLFFLLTCFSCFFTNLFATLSDILEEAP